MATDYSSMLKPNNSKTMTAAQQAAALKAFANKNKPAAAKPGTGKVLGPAVPTASAIAATKAKNAATKAKSTSARDTAQAKNSKAQGAARSASTSKSAKTSTAGSSIPSVGGGSYGGDAFLAGAQDQFGYNPTLQYQPIDTSKMMDLLGKWDPNSIADVYKPAYENIERLRTQGKADYQAGDGKLATMYSGLQGQIRDSAAGIQAGYDTARNNIGADAKMLSSAAASDASTIQNNRAAMMKNLGIEAAAPDLVANDNAAIEGSQRVTQAAGTQTELSSLLGANAKAYTENTANNAGLIGAEARTNLMSQLNDYMSDLAGKQSEVDTSRSQAVATGYQNYQDAYRNLGIQKMQFDMQNNQNSYNAANQNNQNAMSMYKSWQDQMAADQAAASQANSAWQKSQQDALDRAQQQSNWEREQATRERAAGGKGPTDLYSVIQQAGAQRGLSGTQLNSVMSALNGAAARNGLGNSPGAFADAIAKVGVPGVDPNVLAALAAQYWQASGTKASNNVY